MSLIERYLAENDPEQEKILFEQYLQTLPCIMYQKFTYCYINRSMLLKELLCDDIQILIISYLIKLTDYPMDFLCEKTSIMTDWVDLSLGFCSGTCNCAYDNRSVKRFYFYRFPEIKSKYKFITNSKK